MTKEESLEYGEATMEYRNSMIPCKLKLTEQGIAYKNVKTGKVENLSGTDIEVVNWQRLAASYGIRIFTSAGMLHRFGGFKDSDQSAIEKFFKNSLNITMTSKEYSVKGWNYGAAKFEGSVLSFEVSGLPAFDVPLNQVCSTTTGKNEVTLEFHQPDEAPTNLMEMRFHIPPSELAGEDPVESFQQKVMEKASVIQATGETLAIFQEIHCLTPRGRYDIKIYPSCIQLHGKSYNFNIPTESVLRLFLLPHMDGRNNFFVVSLDPPIKQGQTRYPYLIMMFTGDEEDEIELPLSVEELKEKFDGRLEKELTGPQHVLMSRMFKGVCARKIVTPGSFLGHSGNPCVSCSYKAAAGYLYPLERGFIYCYKPPIHIRFEEVVAVNFARSGSTGRSFDFEVEVKNSGMFTFSSIEKGEYNRLFDFVKSKNLRIRNHGKMGGTDRRKDEFADSDNDEPDHYMNRVKADAEMSDGGDEEESSTDEDFAPDEDGSDVAEEFDSDAPDSEDSNASGKGGDDEGKKPKQRKKSKTVREEPRKRRQKKEKDENKPKRPMSAYFFWLNAHRDQIKADNPGIGLTDVSKKAGELWRALDDKTKWEEKSAAAKKEYEVAMEEYKSSGGAAAFKASQSPKKKKSKTSTSSATPSATTAGSGGGFKSKEYIESEGSDDENSDKEKKKPTKNGKQSEGEESEEEESMEEDAASD